MKFLLGNFYSAGPKLTAVGSGEQKVAARPLPKAGQWVFPIARQEGSREGPPSAKYPVGTTRTVSQTVQLQALANGRCL